MLVKNCENCGSEFRTWPSSVKRGGGRYCSLSCRPIPKARFTKHRMTGTPEYQAWQDVFQRCYNPRSQRYDRYGARGIKVCVRWTGEDGFAYFLADMGRRPGEGYSIERLNNDGHYEPGNCVWGTQEQQNRNRSDNRILEHRGKRQTAAEWARELGINKQTFLCRLWAGWSAEKAIETPVGKRTWKSRAKQEV